MRGLVYNINNTLKSMDNIIQLALVIKLQVSNLKQNILSLQIINQIIGCCQQISNAEKEHQITGFVSIKEQFSPKTLQMQPLQLNLIKGDNECIDLEEKMERLGSTCIDNVLIEKQLSQLENQLSLQSKNDVIINLRHSNSTQLVKDNTTKNLNKKFIGML
ncbi:unnamed protein product (macronuclear) [Paramecium tetraurelia]|uniref:Uncharacterized protein n=1 Tax=Paramecium tetraurelia TaxID=5888 RepID=A0EIJ8_PARTE|nr:uncharacterized protein GSPATT00027468001 [Paramecium tetraurelia]CAK95139.1 unnamed protein product [Paramecium tetraurelia]|eukprot:XP_001462512.1 hypothetical protein (macronuclear) [Paramecium tetraurelia strain d4-2]